MADKMTLEQTLSFFRSVIQSGEPWTEACESAYSAAMAHLAGMGEPVAEVDAGDDGLFVEILYGNDGSPLKIGDKLYLASPASGDWDKVRYVAARMRWKGKFGLDARAATLVEWADKLTAALPENANV